MLLPAANIYERQNRNDHRRLRRPQLPSFDRYNTSQSRLPPVSNLVASCRALQTKLGEGVGTDIGHLQTDSTHNLYGTRASASISSLGSSRLRKRSHSNSEDSHRPESRSAKTRSPLANSLADGPPKTPKRRRRAPGQLPLGLQEADFELLSPNVQADASLSTISVIAPDPSEPPQLPAITLTARAEDAWSSTDDGRLVDLVLAQVDLSAHVWRYCAHQLGRNEENIGKRWQMLLGAGSIGLRQETGICDKLLPDIKSW